MPRKTVHEVIANVLRDASREMTVREIYGEIVKSDLYQCPVQHRSETAQRALRREFPQLYSEPETLPHD